MKKELSQLVAIVSCQLAGLVGLRMRSRLVQSGSATHVRKSVSLSRGQKFGQENREIALLKGLLAIDRGVTHVLATAVQ